MRKIVIFIGVLLIVTSCGNEQKSAKNVQIMEDVAFASSKKVNPLQRKRAIADQKTENVKVERKLIKTGNVEFESKDLEKTRNVILSLVQQHQGYVSRDNQYKSYDRISSTLSVRFPSNNFDDILSNIAKGVDKFDSKNIHISDVTEQFLDVEARLKTKKALEVKYLEILKKAKTVREILDVERELGKLRGDIEATEGRLKYLQNQVSFSTLNITFYKKIIENETIGYGSKIKEAFVSGFRSIKAFLVSMIAIWPFIIILLTLIFFIRKKIKS